MQVQTVDDTPGVDARPQPELAVAIGGLGTIGLAVAARLDQGLPGLKLVAVSARDTARAERAMADFRRPVPVAPIEELAAAADIVVECVSPPGFRAVAESTVRSGRTLMSISVGALIEADDLVALARRSGARIIVPTGALLGLDAVQAAAQGTISSVTMVTRKPPRGLHGAPYLVARGIDLSALAAPRKIFEGSAREAVRGFPENVNVAAALSLAGIGPDRTRMEIWADPALDRNTHTITVEGDSAQFTMTIRNVPSESNPKTGKITALSIIAALKKLAAPLAVGT